MASKSRSDGDHEHIIRPRPVKPGNPMVLRAQSEEYDAGLKPNGGAESHIQSSISSGRSTPLPPDALPSAKSISSARKQIRAQNKHRMFPTIDYSARVSHFDPKSDYKDFRGFFVLFWVGLAIMVITTMLRNIKDTGYPLRVQVWSLLTANTWQLALSDIIMVASTSISLPLQQIFRQSKGWLRWENGGMAIQSIFQAAWTIAMINWPFMLNWTWTSQVFFTLHTLVFLMKMHSYAFYNGHLSTTEHRLSALDTPESASTAAAVRYPSSSALVHDTDKVDTDTVADKKKHDDEKEALSQLREDLAVELTSPLGQVTYPQNLTAWNYVDYVMCPTLCYELEYPRTEKTQWLELFYKTLAVFGCIFLLTITSEEFIVPVLSDSAQRLAGVSNWVDQGLILAENISLLLFPFMVTILLVFLVIFEYVLGAFAEITCFADRHFYSDWWNSCDWLEFSREWNIPVHHFLRRHVYGAARPKLSRNMATLVTFLISAAGHELVMSCITKKLRGYGFLAQMSQLPIVAIQKSQFVKGRKLFNNVMFWISFILGLSVALTRKFDAACHLDTMKTEKILHPTWTKILSTRGHYFTLTHNVNLASSILRKPFVPPHPPLQSLYQYLPEPIKPHAAAASSFLNRNLPRPILDYITDPAFVSAVCLPLLLVVLAMSSGWGRSFWSSGGGGRYSPFGPSAMTGPPRVTDDDYHYLGPDDIVDPPRGGSRPDGYDYASDSIQRNASRADSANPLSPDILVLKHRSTTYPLHFPAFAIAEGQIRVSEIRHLAAKETKCEDPRRIKLLYKGRVLKDDAKACRDEGLKQNSELMCVVSEGPIGGGSRGSEIESSESADEDDPYENGGPRVEVDGTIRHPEPKSKRKGHRGGRRRKGRDSGTSSPVTARDSGFLAPEPMNATGRSRSPSPRRPSPPAAAPKQPTTAAGKLEHISSTFYTEFLPKVVQFTSHPPSDRKTRDFEYKKLSEGILAQVILKLDAVETEGDEDLRAKRKSLVKETQRVLNGLDEIGKGKTL